MRVLKKKGISKKVVITFLVLVFILFSTAISVYITDKSEFKSQENNIEEQGIFSILNSIT